RYRATAGASTAKAERGAPRRSATSTAPAKSAAEGCMRRLPIVPALRGFALPVVALLPLDDEADHLGDEDERRARQEPVEGIEAEELLHGEVRVPVDERLRRQREDQNQDEDLPESPRRHVSPLPPGSRARAADPRRRT